MARKKSRKKAQFGGLSAAAIKKATEQAKKAQEAAKKPTPKPVETTQPISPTSGFTGTRGTFTPPTSPPTAPVQPPVRPPVVQPPVRPPVVQPPVRPAVTTPQPTPQPTPPPKPKPTQPQPTPEVPDETGGVLRQVAPQPVPWQYKNLEKMHYQTPDSTRTMAPNQAEVVRRAEQEQLRLFKNGEYEKAKEIAVKIGQLSTAQNMARGEALRNYGVRTTDHEFQKGWKQAKINETNVGFGGLDQYINMEGIDQLNPYLGTWGKTTPGQQADLAKAWETKDPSNLEGSVLAEYNRLYEQFGGKPSGGEIAVGGVRPAGQPAQNVETGQTEDDQITDDQITDDQITDDQVTDDQITDDQVTDDQVEYEQNGYSYSVDSTTGVQQSAIIPNDPPIWEILTSIPKDMTWAELNEQQKKAVNAAYASAALSVDEQEAADWVPPDPNTEWSEGENELGYPKNWLAKKDSDPYGWRWAHINTRYHIKQWELGADGWRPENAGEDTGWDHIQKIKDRGYFKSIRAAVQAVHGNRSSEEQDRWYRKTFGDVEFQAAKDEIRNLTSTINFEALKKSKKKMGAAAPVNILRLSELPETEALKLMITEESKTPLMPLRRKNDAGEWEVVRNEDGEVQFTELRAQVPNFIETQAATGDAGESDVTIRGTGQQLAQSAAKAKDQTAFTPEDFTAVTKDEAGFATGQTLDDLDTRATSDAIEAPGLTERAEAPQRQVAAEQEAKAEQSLFIEDVGGRSEIDKVTGEQVTLAITPDAELQQRTAITNIGAASRESAEIIKTAGYEAAQARTFTGRAAKGAAANMVAQVGNLPNEISAAIVEDPAEVEAQIDTQPVEVQAAIAALPTEALVSSQMENLLADMDQGEIPSWAKPAVALINSNLAERGLQTSSVGRDSLFNAIIQSAMPIAQSNAQALQSRAAQNLSNLQQANLAEATSEMQLRMSNLANRQTAEGQTAQMAQSMSTLQSQFTQQAVLTSAEQLQQTEISNLQNRQQAAVLESQNQQAINAQELSNEQQIELANLQLMSATERENITAQNQERLSEMQIAADFISKNAGFKQQMEVANLSNDQQMRLAHLTALNQADSENLNAAQQTELANLNKRMQVNTTSAQIAQQMNLAQLNVDQQRAVQNAATIANIDLTKFNAAQQVELANSKFMQSATLADFNASQQAVMQNATALASLDMATLDANTKLQAQNAQAFLQMDMANLSNNQQAEMLNSQQKQQQLLSNQSAQNAAEQFNATSQNQVDTLMVNLGQQVEQFNAQQSNAMRQFNSSIIEQRNARMTGQELQESLANAQMFQQAESNNAQMQNARYQFNMQNQVAIEQAYLQYKRQSAMADTAAQNEANRINVQNAFNLTAAEQAFMYQSLRDEASYIRQSYENEETRKAQLYIAAIGNETAASSKDSQTSVSNLVTKVSGLFGTNPQAEIPEGFNFNNLGI